MDLRFPAEEKRRSAWIKMVDRPPNAAGEPWRPGKNARLCSEHFMAKKSDDPHSVDFVPTMFKKFEGAEFSYIPWRPVKKFNAW